MARDQYINEEKEAFRLADEKEWQSILKSETVKKLSKEQQAAALRNLQHGRSRYGARVSKREYGRLNTGPDCLNVITVVLNMEPD